MTNKKLAWVAGASEGIGLAFAESLAARGYNLRLLARRESVLAAAADHIVHQHDVEVLYQSFDLGASNLTEALQGWLDEGVPNIAVYNAAATPIGPFLNESSDSLNAVVNVNVRGVLLFSHTIAKAMAASRPAEASIILMSSLAGNQGVPRIASYAASKSYITHLAESLWAELQPLGINVHAVCAGGVRTPGYARASDVEAPGMMDPEEVSEYVLRKITSAAGPRLIPGMINKIGDLVMGRLLPRRIAIKSMGKGTEAITH